MDPFIGEIKPFAGNFAPRGWAFCNGQLMPISQNTALFSLLGTVYGGDGKSNFALPDLQGRTPIHQGTGAGLTNRVLGEEAGSVTVTLNSSEIPAHSHLANCSTQGSNLVNNPKNAVWSNTAPRVGRQTYGDNPSVNMSEQALHPSGGGQAHNNRQPYLAVNYIIALVGLYPQRS